MERSISPFKPGLSKKWQLFTFGMIWLFICTFLIRKGMFYLFDYSHYILYNIVLGGTIGLFIFGIVLNKMIGSSINNILKSDNGNSGMPYFTGIKGFIFSAIVIVVAFFLGRFQYVNLMSVHVFYLSVGTALLIGSLKLFYASLLYRKHTERHAPVEEMK